MRTLGISLNAEFRQSIYVTSDLGFLLLTCLKTPTQHAPLHVTFSSLRTTHQAIHQSSSTSHLACLIILRTLSLGILAAGCRRSQRRSCPQHHCSSRCCGRPRVSNLGCHDFCGPGLAPHLSSGVRCWSLQLKRTQTTCCLLALHGVITVLLPLIPILQQLVELLGGQVGVPRVLGDIMSPLEHAFSRHFISPVRCAASRCCGLTATDSATWYPAALDCARTDLAAAGDSAQGHPTPSRAPDTAWRAST